MITNRAYLIEKEDKLEFIGQIIDIFEDFLEEKGISIPNEDRDNDPDLEDESAAIIYGNDYYLLEEKISETLANWNIVHEFEVNSKLNKFLKIKEELISAISEGFIELDTKNPENIMVYREASETSPAGWYSDSILDVVNELVASERQYKEFKDTLEEVRKENYYGK